MKWLIAIQLLFGILFAHRTMRRLYQNNFIEKPVMIKIGFALLMSFLITSFAFFHHPRAQFVTIALFSLLLLSLDLIFKRRLESRIQREFPDFITRVILSMKTGLSFRSAVDQDLKSGEDLWRRWLGSMLHARVFLQHSKLPASGNDEDWWRELLTELRTIQENPHHGLPRLESLRRRQRVFSEFRRKSGQAMLQARIQLVVMTFLYLALLVVTMLQFDLLKHLRCLWLSLTLFLAGQFAFWWLARKTKWIV